MPIAGIASSADRFTLCCGSNAWPLPDSVRQDVRFSTHPFHAVRDANAPCSVRRRDAGVPRRWKTRTIVQRVQNIASSLPPRKGIAVLSFTNSAIDEFLAKCRSLGLNAIGQHPNFVGTFDAFLRQFFVAPYGPQGGAVKPTFADSWTTLRVEIRLRGRAAFRGPGASLDRFDPATNAVDPALIGHNGLRAHVIANRAAYQQIARQTRAGFRRKGYFSAA